MTATVRDAYRLVTALGRVMQLHDGEPCGACGQPQPCATVRILSTPELVESTTAVMDLLERANDEIRRGGLRLAPGAHEGRP